MIDFRPLWPPADPQGRVYSGSWHLDENGHSAPSYLFRIDTDGSGLTQLTFPDGD